MNKKAKTSKITKTKKTAKLGRKNHVAFSVTLFSISYLGSLCRTAVFAALYFAITMLTLGLSETTRAANVPSVFSDSLYLFDTLRGLFIMTGVFAIYDLLYVTIAKRYGIFPSLDRLFLLLTEFVFVIVWWLPWLWPWLFDSSFDDTSGGAIWFMAFAILLPAGRAFLGASYAVMTRKTR